MTSAPFWYSYPDGAELKTGGNAKLGQMNDATVALLAPMVASGSSGQVDVCHILINSNAFLFID